MRRDQKGTAVVCLYLLFFFNYKAIVYKPLHRSHGEQASLGQGLSITKGEITFLRMDDSAEGGLTQFW